MKNSFLILILILSSCSSKEIQTVQKKEIKVNQTARFEGDRLIQTLALQDEGNTVKVTGEIINPLNTELTLQTANPTLHLEILHGGSMVLDQYEGMMFTMEIRELKIDAKGKKTFEWKVEKSALPNGPLSVKGKWNIFLGESQSEIQKEQSINFEKN
ncbi:MAG: hypothetical protein SFU91_15225 [Chloroherpetonaceae bacterium]|nr:hypothetical protein [Chloroherpetonaceae bacterium]